MNKHILFVGGGNMGRAIIGGLIANGYPKELISVADPDAAARTRISDDHGVATTANATITATTDIVLLAVKPQIMQPVARELAAGAGSAHPLYVSIAAGVTTGQLTQWLGSGSAIVRVMPNTPSMVGCGASALFATGDVDTAGREDAAAILGAVGTASWVHDEAQLDAVTALSGSGPAYFFLILEILERIGAELGLEPELARELAIETAHGAAVLARTSTDSPGILREQVTSPGGTTAAALNVLGERDLEGVLRAALNAAHGRSIELATESGQ